ncbi:MAG: hypothetical protein J1E61_03540 [Lachnospiraceae bacterium]|nr:hypothetical protein [Lachnospiraceae bacterium]
MKRTKLLLVHSVWVIVLLSIGFFLFDTHSMGELSAAINYRESNILRIALSLIFFVGYYKAMFYMSELFSIKQLWLFLTDFGAASLFARLIDFIMNRRNNTILTVLGRPMDFFDLCVGIGVVGLSVFIIEFIIAWYRVRPEYVNRGTAWEKFCWETKLSLLILRSIFLSEKELTYDLDELMEKSKEKWFHKAS